MPTEGSLRLRPLIPARRLRAARLHLARLLALCSLLVPAIAAPPATVLAQQPPDEPVVVGGQVVGHHYRQTGGGTGLGFDVRAPFLERFTSLGGPTIVGYPVASPFIASDGCTYQDFQVMLLQACPGEGVRLANTFQILEENGADERLNQLGIGRGESDNSTSFQDAVRIRLGWLEDSAIGERYLNQCGSGNGEAAIQFCGLPMNHPRSFGPFVSQRFQRIAFQRWLADGPGGIRAGDVTASLGGDLLKETAVLTGAPAQPHAIGQPPALAQFSFTNVGVSTTPVSPAAAPTPVGFRDRATLGVVQAAVEAAPRTSPSTFSAGREGQDLAVGDVVRTNANGTALVTYFQGTTAEVTQNSTFLIQQLELAPSGGPVVSVTQSSGSVIHRVGQLLLPGSQYKVQSGNATMVIRGSLVRTSVLSGSAFRVEAFTGIADLTSGGVTVTVNPGQFSDAAPNAPPTPPQQNNAPRPPDNPPATGGAAAQPTVTVTPTASPTPPPAGRSTALAYGFQGDFFNTSKRPQAISLIKNAGFGWAKQQVRWNEFEIDQATCNSNASNCLTQSVNGRNKYFKKDMIGFLDAVIDDVKASGLNLLISVVRSPKFYAAEGGETPANPDMLRDFLQFLASRYKGKISAIEPWNEQNLSWEWGASRLWSNKPSAPPQGAVDFVALQKAAYQGIKAADSSVIVVLPAATPTGFAECWENVEARSQSFCLDAMNVAIDDRLYLDFVYQVNGGEVKNYYDVLGIHPSGYNNGPDDFVDKQSPGAGNGFKGHGSFYIKRYQQLRAVQTKYGDSKPMWFTEVGWSSTRSPVPGYEYAQDNTEAERGQYFGRMMELIYNEAPYVTNVIIWNLNFRTLVAEGDEKFGFGVVDASGGALPAYSCLADFVKSGNKVTRSDCR